MRANKTFEIDFGKRVFSGEYYFDGNKLVIEEVYTQNEEEKRVEVDSINDAELFAKIYTLVEKDKCDEINEEREAMIAEKYSRLSDF